MHRRTNRSGKLLPCSREMRAEREKTFTLSSSLSLHTVDTGDERYLLVVPSRRYCDFCRFADTIIIN